MQGGPAPTLSASHERTPSPSVRFLRRPFVHSPPLSWRPSESEIQHRTIWPCESNTLPTGPLDLSPRGLFALLQILFAFGRCPRPSACCQGSPVVHVGIVGPVLEVQNICHVGAISE